MVIMRIFLSVGATVVHGAKRCVGKCVALWAFGNGRYHGRISELTRIDLLRLQIDG
jgi:hypothetical protein